MDGDFTHAERIPNSRKKVVSQQRVEMQVSPFEREFVLQMRKYTHGRVTAVMLDGVPIRIETHISEMILPNEVVNTGIEKTNGSR